MVRVGHKKKGLIAATAVLVGLVAIWNRRRNGY